MAGDRTHEIPKTLQPLGHRGGTTNFRLAQTERVCRQKANTELFPKQQILDSSKLKEFADDKFKYENTEQLSKRRKNSVGKGEIALFE